MRQKTFGLLKIISEIDKIRIYKCSIKRKNLVKSFRLRDGRRKLEGALQPPLLSIVTPGVGLGPPLSSIFPVRLSKRRLIPFKWQNEVRQCLYHSLRLPFLPSLHLPHSPHSSPIKVEPSSLVRSYFFLREVILPAKKADTVFQESNPVRHRGVRGGQVDSNDHHHHWSDLIDC